MLVEMWKNWNFTSCWWGHRVASVEKSPVVPQELKHTGSSPHRYIPLKAEKGYRPRRNLEKMEREGRGETKSRKKRKHFKSEETGQLLMLVLHITETHQTIKRQQC